MSDALPTIPLAEAKRRARRPPKRELPDGAARAWPITALGHLDGRYWFLTMQGERRGFTASQLMRRGDVSSLFGGSTAWLSAEFPPGRGENAPYNVGDAGEELMRLCTARGLYGDHVAVRRIGVWRGEQGMPVANVGDALFVGGEKRAVGASIAGQIFVACPPETHPAAKPAPVSVAQGICADIEELWNFRDPGGSIMAVGLVGAGLLAAALDWRPNGFLTGPSNAGKSHLLNVLNAMAALSFFSTDTTKAGIESAVNGRAVPIFLDEASDRADATQNLIDVVLSASSGAGTKLHRGTADGVGRSIEVCTAIVMASVSPPPMLPQHRSRFVLIELMKPEAGADHRAEMAALTKRCAQAAPGLLARALRSFGLYEASLAQFRAALGRAGCVAREMDQMGALLAGWWYLVEDAPPNDAQASNTVKAVANFIRGSDVMSEEDAPRQVLSILLSRVVNMDRSTDQESLARLLTSAMSTEAELETQRQGAVRVLERWGMRVVRAMDVKDFAGRPVPRLGDGDGVWINFRAEPLKGIFNGTPFAGDRWLTELRRLDQAKLSSGNVRVGALPPGRAIWLGADALGLVGDG
jgi:hypothetical protein